jgi:hypothetical protein
MKKKQAAGDERRSGGPHDGEKSTVVARRCKLR